MLFFSRFEERADTGRGFADDQVIQHFFFLKTHWSEKKTLKELPLQNPKNQAIFSY